MGINTLRTLNYGNYGIFLIMGITTFRTLNSGNYGIFLIMSSAGFISPTVEGILRPQTLPGP